MILRPATEADAPELADVATRAFVSAFGHLYKPEDLAAFLAEYRTPQKYLSYMR
ncbi:MAG: hypothetical protein JOZ89_10805, partial [Gammaproteobacteria bacterium]|nr:hypothetical protein [Gammaproteobacteria bacterium]